MTPLVSVMPVLFGAILRSAGGGVGVSQEHKSCAVEEHRRCVVGVSLGWYVSSPRGHAAPRYCYWQSDMISLSDGSRVSPMPAGLMRFHRTPSVERTVLPRQCTVVSVCLYGSSPQEIYLNLCSYLVSAGASLG